MKFQWRVQCPDTSVTERLDLNLQSAVQCHRRTISTGGRIAQATLPRAANQTVANQPIKATDQANPNPPTKLTDIQRPLNRGRHKRAKKKKKKKSHQITSLTDSSCQTLSLLEEDYEKMKLNEPERQKSKRQISWQLVKHERLYSDLLQDIKESNINSLQQRRP